VFDGRREEVRGAELDDPGQVQNCWNDVTLGGTFVSATVPAPFCPRCSRAFEISESRELTPWFSLGSYFRTWPVATDRTLALDPNHVDELLTKTLILVELFRFEEAREVLEKVRRRPGAAGGRRFLYVEAVVLAVEAAFLSTFPSSRPKKPPPTSRAPASAPPEPDPEMEVVMVQESVDKASADARVCRAFALFSLGRIEEAARELVVICQKRGLRLMMASNALLR
jgi:hypothetical protein